MPSKKDKKPAARGPLAKVAMSRSGEFVYEEQDADEGDRILKIEGNQAIENFEHPDFDKRKFNVYEWELPVKNRGARRTWRVAVHALRDGVVIRKTFSFKCGASLKLIKEINQVEQAAIKPCVEKKLQERSGAL